ncbi:hypothetical protein [Cellulomonas xylanilytica]|uniref:Uncharacterized protein n=1 Tax=Cellulomonas xylanilytica TaxID=233583 RepID=A0A510UZM2_9CELL|nr:hypothetical protein [Cellulomonas xylanilytica]GEK20108.1 hypothetical protein CXY01_06280 [Cellulomonas xylanilytica]
MSTSDPHRPGGATDRPDGTTEPGTGADASVEQTTPSADDSPAHEVAPTVETLDPPAPSEPTTGEPTTSANQPTASEPTTRPVAASDEPVAGSADPELPPTAATPVAGAAPVAARSTGEPAADTGRHAVVRPAPTPPDEPTTADTSAVDTSPDPVRSSTAPAAPAVPAVPTTPSPAPTTPEPVAEAAAPAATEPSPPASPGDDRLFPDPNAPRTTSVGSHILGVIVGLILAPIGVAVLLLGESRILQAQVQGWDASTEVLGIVLVSLGLLLLGCVLLLALWTPAVPITGGTVLTLAGIVYLYLPSVAREQTLNLLSSSGWRLTVTQVTVAGTSGMVLAVGFLLLLAGIVAGSARRRGARLGEFRERHRV